jgi:hypothetical protein
MSKLIPTSALLSRLATEVTKLPQIATWVACAVCGCHASEIVLHDDGSTLRFHARCHGKEEEFFLSDAAVTTVFRAEAEQRKAEYLRQQAAQTRKNHAVKRRNHLSAKRNGGRCEGGKK